MLAVPAEAWTDAPDVPALADVAACVPAAALEPADVEACAEVPDVLAPTDACPEGAAPPVEADTCAEEPEGLVEADA